MASMHYSTMHAYVHTHTARTYVHTSETAPVLCSIYMYVCMYMVHDSIHVYIQYCHTYVHTYNVCKYCCITILIWYVYIPYGGKIWQVQNLGNLLKKLLVFFYFGGFSRNTFRRHLQHREVPSSPSRTIVGSVLPYIQGMVSIGTSSTAVFLSRSHQNLPHAFIHLPCSFLQQNATFMHRSFLS